MVTRLLIEYDGTDFVGWARQPALRSVQEELERVLVTVLQAPVRLSVAGRTDKGVHAWGQVAAYPGPPVRLASLNSLLPKDIAVLACEAAPDGFDPRSGAEARTYCYRVLARPEPSAFLRRTALHWHHTCDRELLHACAAALPGRHDFTAFTLADTEHRWFNREIEAAVWYEDGDVLEFWITADAFLQHMNRTLVGTMLEVAQGRRELSQFVGLLEGAHRREAGHTAKPHGLALASVRFPAVRDGLRPPSLRPGRAS